MRARKDKVVEDGAPKARRARKPKIPESNVSGEGTLCLSDVERLTLLRLDAEFRANASDLLLRRGTLDAYMRKIDPQGVAAKMQEEIALAAKNGVALREKYKQALAAIESKLGIVMTDYSFDDETGMLHLCEKTQVDAPAPAAE